ncbi:MAG: hypothetical protein HYZ20_19260, partial [Burkholderiales bacterium]|nr:hypothetical protein [Burkholderiales bacterium]
GCYTLASGETNNTVDAGLYRPAAIGDRVWLDANANGQQDAGEAGVAGVEVELYTCVGGVPGVKVGASAFTDAAGNYAFTGLTPGDYIVKFITPAGFFFTNQNVGASDAADSDADVATGFTGCYNLESGETDNSVDAGIFKPGEGGVVPSIDLVKLTNGSDNNAPTGPYLPVGSTATFTYLVTNDGMVALSDIDLSDDHGTPGIPGDDFDPTPILAGIYNIGDLDADGLLDVGETWTYQASTVVTAGQYTNLGDVTGTPVDADGNPIPSLPQPTDTDPDNHFGAQAGIHLEKYTNGEDADTPTGPVLPVGAIATFTYVVTNTGNVALADVSLIDDNGTPGNMGDDFPPLFTGGDTDGDGLLDLSETWTYTASHIVTEGQYTNQALTTGTPVTPDGTPVPGVPKPSDDDPSNHFGAAPGIMLVKDAEPTSIDPFEPVTYTYSVYNTGALPLLITSLKDDNATPLDPSDDFDPTPILQGAGDAHPGANVGDLDGDGLLDLTEVWKYSETVILPVTLTTTINGTSIDSGSIVVQQLASGDYRITFLQSTAINDNNYAASGDAPDWDRSHTFSNLTNSDKAGFELKNADGTTVMKFYMDYITATGTNLDGYTSFAGYASLGVSGGDGSISIGSAGSLSDFDSSLETSMNQPGTATNGTAYTAMTANSPIGDPNWDYVMAYSFTVDDAVFGAAGFGSAMIFDQHNSPPKIGDNSFTPEIDGDGSWTNTATVVGTTATGTTVSDDDTATVFSGDAGPRVDIEKYVAPEGYTPFVPMICETLGKPLEMTFDYEPGTTVSNPQGGKAQILVQNGVEDDGISWVIVTDNASASATGARVYFAGLVDVHAEFTAAAANGGQTTFGANTYLHFFDDAVGGSTVGSGLLQSVSYHTSCSQVINLGDVTGNATLVGYVGENGTIDSLPYGEDADTAPGPLVEVGSTVDFTYVVTNPGATPLADVVVTDDKLGTLTLLEGDDGDGLLEAGETWIYRASDTAQEGLQTNLGTVTATGAGIDVSDSDAANYTGAGAPKFFVVDHADDLSYQYDAGGSGLGSFALSNTEARDVAANADGSLLWVLDKNETVNRYDSSGNLLGSWKADSLGKDPEGITVDGNDIWVAERGRKLYWYDERADDNSGSFAANASFSLSISGNLKGIVTDGDKMWVVTEGGTDYVYRFDIARDGSGKPTGLTQDGVWKLPSANSKPTGITLDPTGASDSLWIVDESSDKVYEYAGGRNLTSGTGTISDSFALGAGNNDPQGIADPLAALRSDAGSLGDATMAALLDGLPGAGAAPSSAMLPSAAELLSDGLGSLDSVLGGQPMAMDLGFASSQAGMFEAGDLLRQIAMLQMEHVDRGHVMMA